MGKTTLVTDGVVFIQVIVGFKIFKLSLNLFLTHLRAQIICYGKKRKFGPHQDKWKILQQFEAAVGSFCGSREQLFADVKAMRFEKNSFCRNRQHIRFGEHVNFEGFISRVAIVTVTENWRDLYGKKTSCHPVTARWCSKQTLTF